MVFLEVAFWCIFQGTNSVLVWQIIVRVLRDSLVGSYGPLKFNRRGLRDLVSLYLMGKWGKSNQS